MFFESLLVNQGSSLDRDNVPINQGTVLYSKEELNHLWLRTKNFFDSALGKKI